MRASEIIELEVFKIWRDQISNFADIRIKYGEIIWMNINIAKTEVRQVGEFPAFEYQQKLDIEDISQNLIDSFNGIISHKINLKYPYDKENLYTFITDEQLIKLGFKDKPKSFWQRLFDFSLNGFWQWLERISVVLTIATGLILLFPFLSNNCQRQGAKEPQETKVNQTDSKINSTDSTNILKYDSLQ